MYNLIFFSFIYQSVDNSEYTITTIVSVGALILTGTLGIISKIKPEWLKSITDKIFEGVKEKAESKLILAEAKTVEIKNKELIHTSITNQVNSELSTMELIKEVIEESVLTSKKLMETEKKLFKAESELEQLKLMIKKEQKNE